jgi:8-oxo-dGTP pyrophosphatase MutT (NUDIX family)
MCDRGPARRDWRVTEPAGGPNRPAFSRHKKPPRERFVTKVSVGLILCRSRARGGHEALLVRARYTYAFGEFVHGHYNRRNLRKVADLFQKMTINERLDLHSLDFGRAWARVWVDADRPKLYLKNYRKFYRLWLAPDGGEQLRRLLEQAEGAGALHWSFPRGRRLSNREADVVCAVREFGEETGMPKDSYRLLPGFRRQVCYCHMGVRYVHIFYLALLRRTCHPTLSLRRPAQVAEVGEVRWMGLDELRRAEGPAGRSLAATARAAFNYARNYLKK